MGPATGAVEQHRADRIVLGSTAASYQLTGLSGVGTRTLVVDENGVVSAVSGEAAAFSVASTDVTPLQATTRSVLTVSNSQDNQLSKLMATVESLVQRVDALEDQLAQANDALASAGITVVNPAPSVSVEQL